MSHISHMWCDTVAGLCVGAITYFLIFFIFFLYFFIFWIQQRSRGAAWRPPGD